MGKLVELHLSLSDEEWALLWKRLLRYNRFNEHTAPDWVEYSFKVWEKEVPAAQSLVAQGVLQAGAVRLGSLYFCWSGTGDQFRALRAAGVKKRTRAIRIGRS